MTAAARIGGFVVILGAVFAAASLAGAKLDPSVDEEPETHASDSGQMDPHESAGASAAALPGLAVAQDGYRLVPEQTTLASGPDEHYRFRIDDEDGETVREFDLEHERRMHLIVVRRDFTEFQHLHPRQLADGSWEVEADLSEAGVYRVFADFSTAGNSLTLATDLFVPGQFAPRPLPAPSQHADAGDGYEVTLESAPPRSGGTNPARFTVSRHGREVDSVEPYLGADGHLVALREHDQAFLHTHPQGDPGGPGPIAFAVEYPTAGSYRLFLQFKHQGVVRTAAFTQQVGRGAPGATDSHTSATESEAGDGGH